MADLVPLDRRIRTVTVNGAVVEMFNDADKQGGVSPMRMALQLALRADAWKDETSEEARVEYVERLEEAGVKWLPLYLSEAREAGIEWTEA